MIPLTPLPQEVDINPAWTPTEEQTKRLRRITQRIDLMLEERRKYEDGMHRSLLLYSGKSRQNPYDTKREKVVVPLARAFVEAKTSEEMNGMNSYEFVPGKEASDQWRVKLMKDVDAHIRQKTSMDVKRLQALRMKNIMGVAILKVGYRKIMRKIKDPVETDEDNTGLKWKERLVPIYDDLFIDLVSPFNFAVDPNATNMGDAMDCAHFHTEHFATFQEMYGNDKRFDITSVKPGTQNMVDVCEYYNKIMDEWVILAVPSRGDKRLKWEGTIPPIEIYYGPLPDDHKELPFVSYHNNPTYTTEYFRKAVSLSSEGIPLAQQDEVRSEEGFWTEGDPMTLMDLIDLRTGFGRAAYHSLKLSSQSIIATAPGFAFDEKVNWREGAQAIGMMGKFDVRPVGGTNISNFQFVFDDLMNLMVLCIGIDPRNLADNKEKTATESAIQKETQMRRLQPTIEYNEKNGEVRLGTLILKLAEQRYSKPELVRLTGLETEQELSAFDDVEKDSDTGKPIYGARYRSIRTDMMVKEKRRKNKDGTYKYYLTPHETGSNSFLARPEWIRSSDIHVIPQSTKQGDQLRSVQAQLAKEAIQLFMELMNVVNSTPPGAEPLIKPEDLPDIKKAIQMYLDALGWDTTSVTKKDKPLEAAQKMKDSVDQYMQMRKPLEPDASVQQQPQAVFPPKA